MSYWRQVFRVESGKRQITDGSHQKFSSRSRVRLYRMLLF
nr:MAG TPA: hypothetical protein [Caudoviricetes sp.]